MSHRLAIVALAATIVATVSAQDDYEPGLTMRVYDVGHPMERLYDLAPDQTPNLDERRDTIDWPGSGGDFGPFAEQFIVEAVGYIEITDGGRYGFELTSDDGSSLVINDVEVARHDGLHAESSREGTIDLEPGLHPFRVLMFENGGGEALRLGWRPPGVTDFTIVPASAFRIERGVTRVVSPGGKRVMDGTRVLLPGHGLPVEDVHPSWTLETIRPKGFEPQVGGMDFLPDGRLVLSSFKPVNNGVFREEPNGTVWAVEGLLGDDTPVTTTLLAEGFHDPAGLAVVDGDIYVAHRENVTRLADGDGDGVFETRDEIETGWVSDNYHHFTFGLVPHEGWLYGSLSTSIYFGNTIENDNVTGQVVSMNGPNPPHRGTCWRLNLATRDIEFVAGGFRTPNGLGVGPEGEIFVTDNQGAWLPASKLVHVQPGRFYGHYNGTEEQVSDRYPDGGAPSLHSDQPPSPPAVWLPQNECANSPTESMLIGDGEFAGQMLVAELTMGGLRRVFLEKVNGVYQGAVFRHSQGFECGINRMVTGPDGCLYLGGTGADGNWSWRGTRFGLQRLRPAKGSAFEYHSIRATPTGFEVRFTKPVDRTWLADPESWTIRQWHYEPTAQYGGPKHDEETLDVVRAKWPRNRRSVDLEIPGLRPGAVVHFAAFPTSDSGETIRSSDAWYTLNEVPVSGR